MRQAEKGDEMNSEIKSKIVSYFETEETVDALTLVVLCIQLVGKITKDEYIKIRDRVKDVAKKDDYGFDVITKDQLISILEGFE
jgi:hypothetical protein